MAIILTRKGKEILVDDADVAWLSEYCWHLNNGYAASSHNSRENYMHRMILGLTDSHIKVDHKDSNKLNNQRSNLRICTQAQNLKNKSMRSDNTTGYVGVIRYRDTGKFISSIWDDGRRIHLGIFQTAEDAALAYDSEAEKLFGEFAKTNRSLGKFSKEIAA